MPSISPCGSASCVTAALLGRFLPRLGPLDIQRPFFAFSPPASSPLPGVGEHVDRARRQVLQAAHSRCRQLGVEFCATRCTCCGAATLVAVARYGRFLPRLGHWFILVTPFLFGDLPPYLFLRYPHKQGQIRIRRRPACSPLLACGDYLQGAATCSCPGRMRESRAIHAFDKIPIRRRTCKDAVPAEQSR